MDDEYSPQALAVVAYSTSEEDSEPDSEYDSDLEIQTIYTSQPMLDDAKGKWVEELPHVLWTY